jgi:septal ring factor EnvC (AmiA/AmiB activator)
MKYLPMILRIVAIVAAIAATTLYFISKGKLAEKQDQLTRTQQVLASTQTDLSETTLSLRKTESQLARESEELAKTKSTLVDVRSELYITEEKVTRSERLLTEARSNIANLETSARDLNANIVDLQAQLVAANRDAEINQLNEQIAELTSINEKQATELEAQSSFVNAVRNSSGTSVDAGMGSPSAGGTQADTGVATNGAKLETTVSSVSTNDGMIVLDSSAEFGLAPGQTFILIRGNKSVAKIQVRSTTESHVLANILPSNAGQGNVKPGSTVQLIKL